MVINDRESAALEKLLKIARTKTDEAGRRIAALEAAREKTDASLRQLAETVSKEEAAARSADIVGLAQLSGFLAGASKKRDALESTKAQIAAEIELARNELSEAYSETQKIEHLVERARLASERRVRRTEANDLNEAAIARFVRKSGR